MFYDINLLLGNNNTRSRLSSLKSFFTNIVFSFQIIMAKPAGGPKPRAGGNRDDD